jgi:cytochrome P450
MRVFKGNIEQIYGDAPSADGAPLAEGDISGLADGTLYLGLHEYAQRFGPVYKLCFGPKSFIVTSDHRCARHILSLQNRLYNKGVLAEILEDIMGKGLIPADPVTWKRRKRAIAPAFHKAWLARMTRMFAEKTDALVAALPENTSVDLEERFGSLALDIIGSAVFNYEFDSVAEPSAVVSAAIETLREAEHRSMTPAPYWKIPGAMALVPRQRRFTANMKLLNGELNKAIDAALGDRVFETTDALEKRDYDALENPSLLRFLVDQRGEEADSTQLRDDLMTMLIAGHETTASALTWCLFELAQRPDLLAEVQAEVDAVLGDGAAPDSIETVRALELVRLTVAESLRMYPQPPLLIRRAVDADELPAVHLPDSDALPDGLRGAAVETKIPRASDMFIAVYSLHRSPRYWEEPDAFDPKRWLRPYKNPAEPDWDGYDPASWRDSGALYPTEASTDFAYMPFGGGARKCVGDQFATIEATVALAGILRNFEFDFAAPTAKPDDVGTNTGATIHTRNGLWMTLKKRAV